MTALNQPPAATGLRDTRPGRIRSHRGPLLQIGLIVLFVVVGNSLYLLGIFDSDPMVQLSGLATSTTHGLFGGVNALDPNSGFTAQALGHRSVLDWFSGHVPWWNPFEGIGAPLAGEMQAAALFPPTILLALANGQVYFHLVLELTAGVTTYLLLRRILESSWVAATGGAAFALNGTFASIQHAPVNAIAFLPMLLLGIEMAREASESQRRGGWALVAVALALSIYSGFPEVGFIDGILALIWFAARSHGMSRARWIAYARKLAAGGCTGLLLASPILAAFVGYLPYADVGGHNGGFADSSFTSAAIPRLAFPYVFGPLSAFNSFDRSGTIPKTWVEGFLSISLIALAAVSLFGRRHRILRVGLVVWIVLALGKTYGFVPARDVLNLIPGIRSTAFDLYAAPSWDFAVVVLATFGLDDLVQGRVRRRWVVVALAGTFLFATGTAVSALAVVHHVVGAPDASIWAITSVVAGLAVLVVVGVVALAISPRRRLVLLAGVVLLEALVLFVIPELSAPRQVTSDYGPVRYLQRHAGSYRFYTLGPIQPNYGSYYSIASINVNDLPIPKLWKTYVANKLDSNVNPLIFTGLGRLSDAGPTAAEEFFRNLPAYEAISVRYLVVPDGLALPVDVRTASLHIVFHDRYTEILELPNATPLFHAKGSACIVEREAVDAVTLRCSRSATLLREELYMPGWSASVNGNSTAVEESERLVQSVAVPRGISHVAFHYQPPDTDAALIGLMLGLVLLVGGPRLASLLGRGTHRKVVDQV